MMLWLVSFQSFSGEQYVFCANQEGTQWEWLPNDRAIDGYWLYHKIKGRAYFVTFRIEKQQYESLKAESINYFPPTYSTLNQLKELLSNVVYGDHAVAC